MLNRYNSWFASLLVLLLAMMLFILGCSISEKPKVDKLSSLWNGKQYRRLIVVYDSLAPSLKSKDQIARARSLCDSARSIVSKSSAIIDSADVFAQYGYAPDAYRLYTRAIALEPAESSIVFKRNATPANGTPIFVWSGTMGAAEFSLTYHTKWVNAELEPINVDIKVINKNPTQPIFLVSYVPFIQYQAVANNKMHMLLAMLPSRFPPEFRKPVWRGETQSGRLGYHEAKLINRNSDLSFAEVFTHVMFGTDDACYIFLLGNQYAKINGFEMIGYDARNTNVNEVNSSAPLSIRAEGSGAKSGFTYISTNVKGFKEYRNEKDGSVLIEVPAGNFKMGNEDDPDPEIRRVHSVYLDKYFISKYEVTVKQFREFVKATGYKTVAEKSGNASISVEIAPSRHASQTSRDANWRTPSFIQTENHPVVCINWDDAKAYCDWAGLRLPTDAEWEKAAKGMDGRKYPWGNNWVVTKCNSSENGYYKTTPVGNYPSGISPYGCYDMAGNVLEWCNDEYSYQFKSLPDSNPVVPPTNSKIHVLRGGSFSIYSVWSRSSCRQDGFGNNSDFGFRIAK